MIINTIQGGKAPVVQSKSVKSTTTQQTVTAPSGVDGYNPITVEPIKLQEKVATPYTDRPYYVNVFPDSGYDGLSEVQVLPVVLQEKTVSPSQSVQTVTPDTSGTYPSGGYKGLSKVTVNAATLQSKTVTPSDSQQIITPDSPNIGLSQVTVEAAPASGTKTAFYQLYASTSTRIRITDTKGITSPRFVVVQYTNLSPVYGMLYEGVYDSAYNFSSRCIYANSSGNILIQALALEVFLDGGDIIIEIKSSNFNFDRSTQYNIFISE